MDRVTLTKQAQNGDMAAEYEKLRDAIERDCKHLLRELEDMKINITISQKRKIPRVIIYCKDRKFGETIAIIEKTIKACGFYPIDVEYRPGQAQIEFEK